MAVTHKNPLEEVEDGVDEQKVFGNMEAPDRVPGYDPAFLLNLGHRAGSVNVPVEGGLVLDIGHVDEDDDFVDVDSLSEHHLCHIEEVGGGVEAHTAVEEVVLRKSGGDSANIGTVPGERTLREGIAKHQDPGTRIDARNFSDSVVAKTEIISKEIISIRTPVLDGGAIGFQGVVANRIKDAASFHQPRCGRPLNRGRVKIIENDERYRAKGEGHQKQCQLDLALPALQRRG